MSNDIAQVQGCFGLWLLFLSSWDRGRTGFCNLEPLTEGTQALILVDGRVGSTIHHGAEDRTTARGVGGCQNRPDLCCCGGAEQRQWQRRGRPEGGVKRCGSHRPASSIPMQHGTFPRSLKTSGCSLFHTCPASASSLVLFVPRLIALRKGDQDFGGKDQEVLSLGNGHITEPTGVLWYSVLPVGRDRVACTWTSL